MRRAVWITLAALAAGCGGHHEHATPRAPDRVVLSNENGRWKVYTRCIPGVVGPGYVARVGTSDGRVLVNDAVGPGTLNDTNYGGLGAFGWHHARGRSGSLRFRHGNAWEISTRACASANRGFGVTASRVLERTAKSLAVEVDLGDRFTRPRPLMSVRYRYDVEPRALRTEITVTELCGLGRCGRTRKLAFVKEPKLVAHAGAAFRRVEVLDDRGKPVCESGAKGPRRGGQSIGALLPAWEGGRGGYDCEPLSRLFGPRGSTWRAELDYSLVR